VSITVTRFHSAGLSDWVTTCLTRLLFTGGNNDTTPHGACHQSVVSSESKHVLAGMELYLDVRIVLTMVTVRRRAVVQPYARFFQPCGHPDRVRPLLNVSVDDRSSVYKVLNFALL
jgi:hypothetical protein